MEVENKMLEPLIVAKEIAEKLERGINARKVIQSRSENNRERRARR